MARGQHESYKLLPRSSTDSDESLHGISSRSSMIPSPRPSPILAWRWISGAFRILRHSQNRLFQQCCQHKYAPSPRSRLGLPTFRLILRLVAATIGGLFVLSVIRAVVFPSYQHPPAHYQELRDVVFGSQKTGRGNLHHEKIFIAANILKEDLIRGPWGTAVRELVDLLGPENVFLSIYENGSGPGTADALRELGRIIPCKSSVATGGHLPLDQFDHVTLPSGERRVKRIAYLAEVRNTALRPLDPHYDPSGELSIREDGFQHAPITYDRILFINDVYFSPLSALHLLFSTNLDPATGRASYQAACAADFKGYAMFYDTFVVRDLEGFGMGLRFYPWFTPSGKAESRGDVLAGKDAVRVRSCWGGMVALDAAPFQQPQLTGVVARTLPTDVIRFRHEPELFWEASECCLVHADMAARRPSAGTSGDTGIYLNPFIRVAYKPVTYAWIPFITRYERFFAILQYVYSRIFYPEYNPRREDRAGETVPRTVWQYDPPSPGGRVNSTHGAFRETQVQATPGGFCGQKRLFVILDIHNGTNKGGRKNWEKIAVPAG